MKKFIPAMNYEFLTPFYDNILNLIGFGYRQRVKIVKLLNLKNGDKVLDVGCGTGSLLIVAKKLNPEIIATGIDIDEKILKIAKNKMQKENLKINFTKTSADKLPFGDSSFDVVVSTLVFHHLSLDVKKRTLEEVKRILKKNGRFLLVDFGKTDNIWINIFYRMVNFLRIEEAATLKDNVNGKLSVLLKQNGFKIKEVALQYLGIQYFLSVK